MVPELRPCSTTFRTRNECISLPGGLGILVGEGQLPHPGAESIVESYYRFPFGPWQLTADYQFLVNSAFNRDRGPVSIVSMRVRTQS
jgi:high affinity Mn2+ porin